MSKHMRPVYDERDDEIDAHSKSRAWDFVVVCIEVFTILCVVKGNTAWIGCLALLFAGMAANMMYRFDEYEERAYFHGGLILGAIAVSYTHLRYAIGKHQGRIILFLFNGNNGPRRNPNQIRQLLLRHFGCCSQFFYPCLHGRLLLKYEARFS